MGSASAARRLSALVVLGSAYDAAGTRVQLAEACRAFGDAASADAVLARAEAVYERLGARRPMRELPNGLTPRGYEVLTLVADRRSNCEIGGASFRAPAPDSSHRRCACQIDCQFSSLYLASLQRP